MSAIDEIILRMVEACGVKNTAQMLRFIEVSSGAAGLWKQRKKVPDGNLAKVSERSGVSLHWLKTGKGEMRSGSLNVVEPKPGQSPDAVPAAIIKDVVTIVEEHLAQNNLSMEPDKKAELIMLLCEEFAEAGQVNQAKVSKLIKLAM